MDYDIEREKQKSTEIRAVFREMFPLTVETDLPWAAAQIPGFLKKRIELEVERGTFHWTSDIVRVLCEISPPKTHAVDMARNCVNAAKEAQRELEMLRAKYESLERKADRLEEKK